MKIVPNSDILFTQKLITNRLPGHLEKLASECGRMGVRIVLPRTVLLEVERRQTQLMEGEITSLERAFATLRNAGVGFENKQASELFALPDLTQLFRTAGAEVSIEEPGVDDFNEAHRRACLHLSPHPPDTKSDEMRDLVIWIIALRLAREGGAILLSRDDLHIHVRGDEEAAAAGLMRAKNVDEALDLLGIENPAVTLVRQILEPIWEDLRDEDLPLPRIFRLRHVEDASFVRGRDRIDQARFTFETITDDERRLRAHVEIKRVGEDIASFEFREILLDGQPVGDGKANVIIHHTMAVQFPDDDEALAELRDIIG